MSTVARLREAARALTQIIGELEEWDDAESGFEPWVDAHSGKDPDSRLIRAMGPDTAVALVDWLDWRARAHESEGTPPYGYESALAEKILKGLAR